MVNKNLLSVIKNGVSIWKENDYHRIHRIQALKAIGVIEKYNSQKLSPRIKKMADDYAIQIFGSIKYAPWLYVYSLVRGDFKEGWIPDNFYSRFVSPNQKLFSISLYKTFSNVIFKTEAFPDIAYYIDGTFYNRKYFPIDFLDLSKSIIDQYSEVFVKSDISLQGKGIHKIGKESFNEVTFMKIGNSVIQSPIKQHKFFEEIISGSTATIRITTVRNIKGIIEFRASYLRLGRKEDEWIQSRSAVKVPVINQKGELGVFGYTPDWRRWSSHPDTNYVFSNKYLPFFKEAVDICIKLHSSIPHFRIIGWDIGISNTNEIKIFEWNAGLTDIKFSESTIGPCFTGLDWEKLG